MTDLWGGQTDTVSKRTCPKLFCLWIERLLVVARMNARPILNMNPFYDEIFTWKTFSSHQIALCVPSKLGVLASNESKNRREEKKSVSLCWPNIKRNHYKGWTVLPLFTLPPFLLAENNVAALLDCYPSPLMIFFNIFYFSCLNRCCPPSCSPPSFGTAMRLSTMR